MEGRSTEDCIQFAITKYEEKVNQRGITAMVSFDIRSAFDFVKHSAIIETPRRIKCPTHLTNMIVTYLSNRKVTYKGYKIEITSGCSQAAS